MVLGGTAAGSLGCLRRAREGDRSSLGLSMQQSWEPWDTPKGGQRQQDRAQSGARNPPGQDRVRPHRARLGQTFLRPEGCLIWATQPGPRGGAVARSQDHRPASGSLPFLWRWAPRGASSPLVRVPSSGLLAASLLVSSPRRLSEPQVCRAQGVASHPPRAGQ